MKLIDIANKIDKSKKNESHINITDFDSEFNINLDYYIEQDRLKAYYIGNWYCTDSYVGCRMYFFDDEPVAISFQQGRKFDEEFSWFSKDNALKVRDYLLSLMPRGNDDLDFTICDLGNDIGEGYSIEFNSQILNSDKATYKGDPIKIIERIRETPDYGLGSLLKVQLLNSEEIIINVKDIEFKFNLV